MFEHRLLNGFVEQMQTTLVMFAVLYILYGLLLIAAEASSAFWEGRARTC